MGVRMAGPYNSGPAVGADGSATANQTSVLALCGQVLAVVLRYNDSPPSSTDVTVATAGVWMPAITLLAKVNANTDATFYPRAQVHDTAGAALTYDGTRAVAEPMPVNDQVKITIAQANAGDSVDVWLLLAD